MHLCSFVLEVNIKISLETSRFSCVLLITLWLLLSYDWHPNQIAGKALALDTLCQLPEILHTLTFGPPLPGLYGTVWAAKRCAGGPGLKQQRCKALAAPVAVGGVCKRFAPAIWGQRLHLKKRAGKVVKEK